MSSEESWPEEITKNNMPKNHFRNEVGDGYAEKTREKLNKIMEKVKNSKIKHI